VLGWVGIATMALVIGLVLLGFLSEKERQREQPSEKTTSQHVMRSMPLRDELGQRV